MYAVCVKQRGSMLVTLEGWCSGMYLWPASQGMLQDETCRSLDMMNDVGDGGHSRPAKPMHVGCCGQSIYGGEKSL